jgi:hypothetical protein
MPHEGIVFFGVVGTIFSLIVAAVIKFLERALTFGQAFLISLATNFVTLVLCYAIAKSQLGIPRDVDMLATLVALSLTGIMITRLSANYGIKKVGWFGLGARVVFVLIGLPGVFTAAVFLSIYLFGH